MPYVFQQQSSLEEDLGAKAVNEVCLPSTIPLLFLFVLNAKRMDYFCTLAKACYTSVEVPSHDDSSMILVRMKKFDILKLVHIFLLLIIWSNSLNGLFRASVAKYGLWHPLHAHC